MKHRALVDRLWRLLGGDDAGGRAVPPAGELFHPLALLALLGLVINDWVLKGGAASGWLTGKLSDVAGLIAFPLVATAAADSVAWGLARLGLTLDFTLRRWKLVLAIGGTGAVFTAMKVWPPATHAVVGLLRGAFGSAAIVTDASDLVALPALGLAYWIGRREIARVPLGRVEYLLNTRRSLEGGLADVVACGGDAARVSALERALIEHAAGAPATPVHSALASLRSFDP